MIKTNKMMHLTIWYRDYDVITETEQLNHLSKSFTYSYGYDREHDKTAEDQISEYIEKINRVGYFDNGVDYIPFHMIVKFEKIYES